MNDVEAAFLSGHTVILRNPTAADVTDGNWHSWFNDQHKTRFNSHGIFPVTRSQELEYVAGFVGRKDALLLAVAEKDGGRLIGTAALSGIDYIDRRCAISIMIGEDAGLTTAVEVFGLLVDHAFCRLNLNRVSDATHAGLADLVAMLGVIGFEEEGRMRQHFLRDGRFSDAIAFGVLAEKFFELKRARSGKILFETREELAETVVEAVRRTR